MERPSFPSQEIPPQALTARVGEFVRLHPRLTRGFLSTLAAGGLAASLHSKIEAAEPFCEVTAEIKGNRLKADASGKFPVVVASTEDLKLNLGEARFNSDGTAIIAIKGPCNARNGNGIRYLVLIPGANVPKSRFETGNGGIMHIPSSQLAQVDAFDPIPAPTVTSTPVFTATPVSAATPTPGGGPTSPRPNQDVLRTIIEALDTPANLADDMIPLDSIGYRIVFDAFVWLGTLALLRRLKII